MAFLDSVFSPVLKDVSRVLKDVSGFFILEKVSVIIPAFNEAKTIRKVVLIALDSGVVSEVIVVDDGSQDNTADVVKGLSKVVVVRHERNLGKGRAIRTGLDHASNEVVLFLDADLQNLRSDVVRNLTFPVLKGEADLVKASFSRARGRLTALAAKPMMRVLFPGSNLSQPLSGQFCCHKSFLREIKIEPRWGFDIAIVLEAMRRGLRVVEVDIGWLVHKERSLDELSKTSEQVLGTMLSKAGLTADKYKVVVFSESVLFDGPQLAQNVVGVLDQLRRRKYKLILLGWGDRDSLEKKANELLMDDFFMVNANLWGMQLLQWFKRVLKRSGYSLEDVVFVSSLKEEAMLLKSVALGIGMGLNRRVRKNESMHADSLSDVLLLE